MTNFIFSKSSLTAALLAGSMLATPALAVTIKGNVGATTDYIWRGDTQSSGDASFSGGIDADFGNGFAVGVWAGSLGGNQSDDSANYELDLYGSYGFALGALSMEVGYISYEYPGVADSADDFEDIYVSAGYGPLSVSYYVDADVDDNTYISIDAEFGLEDDWTLGLHFGQEAFETDPDDDYASISLSKGDVTFTVSGDEDDDTRAIVSWGTSF